MNKYVFTLLVLTIFQSAHAELTTPYKKIDIECSGSIGTLKLAWDYSKSPFVNEILVNGNDEAGLSHMTSEDGITTYSKENVFSISLTKDDDKAQFHKNIMVLGKEGIAICKQTSSWHITK